MSTSCRCTPDGCKATSYNYSTTVQQPKQFARERTIRTQRGTAKACIFTQLRLPYEPHATVRQPRTTAPHLHLKISAGARMAHVVIDKENHLCHITHTITTKAAPQARRVQASELTLHGQSRYLQYYQVNIPMKYEQGKDSKDAGKLSPNIVMQSYAII
ncbi:hypothetical protein CHS0354_039647 [Potamilus streckersoni]|uniref:Uncharacterized protein n=1 Tax=Potamilus streckersoni TaxID=2493646 RepID=A0AAE0SK14_9BIVA|nr:hypothetical protein CHS0354_039647 [Potamilus streckersoni]